MIYVNVEFFDYTLGRYKEFVVALPSLDEDEFPFYPPVCEHLEQWIEEGERPEWSEEEKQDHAEQCEWLWYVLDEEETENYLKGE